jgi:hypothetical protein
MEFWNRAQTRAFHIDEWNDQTNQNKQNKQTHSMLISPQANYTDRPTAVVIADFCGLGGSWSVEEVHTAVNLGFLDRSQYVFFQVVPHLSSRGWVEPIISNVSWYVDNTL